MQEPLSHAGLECFRQNIGKVLGCHRNQIRTIIGNKVETGVNEQQRANQHDGIYAAASEDGRRVRYARTEYELFPRFEHVQGCPQLVLIIFPCQKSHLGALGRVRFLEWHPELRFR